jgi:hypothetical protein
MILPLLLFSLEGASISADRCSMHEKTVRAAFSNALLRCPSVGDFFYYCFLRVVTAQPDKVRVFRKVCFSVYNLKRLENPAARCLSQRVNPFKNRLYTKRSPHPKKLLHELCGQPPSTLHIVDGVNELSIFCDWPQARTPAAIACLRQRVTQKA